MPLACVAKGAAAVKVATGQFPGMSGVRRWCVRWRVGCTCISPHERPLGRGPTRKTIKDTTPLRTRLSRVSGQCVHAPHTREELAS